MAPGMCGKLVYWLYGFRKAASEWENFYAKKLEDAGFRRGVGCPVLFYHRERDLAMAVHGDDFVLCGMDSELEWAASYLQTCFQIKVRALLGGDPGGDKEATVLGRTVRWGVGGIEYEADARHRAILLDTFGLGIGSSRPLGSLAPPNRAILSILKPI